MVETLSKLDQYKWCGHCVIMNRCKNEWQDRRYVLQWFGKKDRDAKIAYRDFVSKGISLGKRPELTGGGLIRSMGGWSIVKAMRHTGTKEESDARILGSGEFVSDVIKLADRKVKFQFYSLKLQEKVTKEIDKLCKRENVTAALLQSGSRRPPLPKLRKTIAQRLINEHGISLAETARRIGISTSGVAQILRRNKVK